MQASAPFTLDLISGAEARTLPELLLRRCEKSPEAEAYRQHDPASGTWRSYRWSEIRALAARWRAALARENLAVGERVAVLLRNSVEWVCFDQAAQSLGLVVVPLYTTDNPENIAYILRDCDARVLLLRSSEQWQALAPLRARFPGLARVLCLERAATAVTFYLVAYTATNLAAFGVVGALSTGARDAEDMDDYRGLAGRHPWLAGIMAVALFSLAGIPLTAGFLGKFYVVTAGGGSALWGLIIVLVLTSTVGLYYYTRIVVAMYVARREPAEAHAAAGPVTETAEVVAPLGASVVLGALTVFLIVFGVYPAPLIRLIERAVSTLP